VLSDNLKSAAMLFGAIEATEMGLPADISARAASLLAD